MAKHFSFSAQISSGKVIAMALSSVTVLSQVLLWPLPARAADSATAQVQSKSTTTNKMVAVSAISASGSATKQANATEAERLYNEAIEFYTVNRFARAYDLGQECCALAPQNSRYRAGLAVFAARDRPLLYSLSTAKEAARLLPNDANVLTNLGILFQKTAREWTPLSAIKRPRL